MTSPTVCMDSVARSVCAQLPRIVLLFVSRRCLFVSKCFTNFSKIPEVGPNIQCDVPQGIYSCGFISVISAARGMQNPLNEEENDERNPNPVTDGWLQSQTQDLT